MIIMVYNLYIRTVQIQAPTAARQDNSTNYKVRKDTAIIAENIAYKSMCPLYKDSILILYITPDTGSSTVVDC